MVISIVLVCKLLLQIHILALKKHENYCLSAQICVIMYSTSSTEEDFLIYSTCGNFVAKWKPFLLLFSTTIKYSWIVTIEFLCTGCVVSILNKIINNLLKLSKLDKASSWKMIIIKKKH